MFIFVEESENSKADERMFSESGEKKPVRSVEIDTPNNGTQWCSIVAVDENGAFSEANAIQVEDSGAGTAILIYGGQWGLRFKLETDTSEWSLNNKDQWGEPFKLLDSTEEIVRYI